MMKTISFGVAAVALCATVPCTQASVASDKAAIKRTYKVMERLMLRGDMAKANVYVTSDFKMRLIDGQVMNWQQAVQVFNMTRKMGQVKALPTRFLSIQAKGNRATVLTSGGMIMRVRNAQGQMDTIHSTGKTRDHWVKIGGTWKERLSEQTSEETRVNGQVVTRNGKNVLGA